MTLFGFTVIREQILRAALSEADRLALEVRAESEARIKADALAEERKRTCEEWRARSEKYEEKYFEAIKPAPPKATPAISPVPAVEQMQLPAESLGRRGSRIQEIQEFAKFYNKTFRGVANQEKAAAEVPAKKPEFASVAF